MDLRAYWRKRQIETVGHTWRPRLQRRSRPTHTSFASPTEYSFLRDSMRQEGASEEWLDWLMHDREGDSEADPSAGEA